jgi:hypothetical protein
VDPFWEKVVLLAIQYGLLTLAGGGIAFISSLVLERYRRHQAVVLELSKLRAQAFVRLVSLLGEHQAVLHAVAGGLARTEDNARYFEALKIRADQVYIEAFTSIPRDMALMDSKVRPRLRAYLNELYGLDGTKLKAAPLSATELEARKDKLRALRDAVLEMVPPL